MSITKSMTACGEWRTLPPLKRHRIRSGQSIIEAIVAVGILTSLLAPLLMLSSPSANASLQAREYTIGAFLAKQGLEGTRSIARATFGSLANGTYGLGETGGVYVFSGVSDTPITGYTRTITVATATRTGDVDGVLRDDGLGVADTETKRVTVRIAWQSGAKNRSVSITTFLTNWE
jgi:hypothetical protein